MKTISKERLSVLLLTVLTLSLIGLPVFAVDEPSTTTTTRLSNDTVCSQIDTVKAASQARVTSRREALVSAYQTRLTELETKRTTALQSVVTARQNAINAFNQKIEKLKTTDGLTQNEIDTISTYAETVTTAEKLREEKVDAARQTYVEGLRQAIVTRQDALSVAVTTYDTAVQTAFDTAKSNCSSASALTTLRSDLKAARNALSSTRASLKQKDELAGLVKTRTEAIKTANQEFKTTVTAATKSLSDALGVTITISLKSADNT